MKQEDECEVEDVPVSPLLSEGRRNKYGSVPGLPDEELADPWELERMAMLQEWGPVLALPVRTRRGWMQPSIDEDGGVDWGAFGTVDFARMMPEFDKARYKADKLQEKLRDVVMMIGMVSERLPRAKDRVLKYLERGVIGLEHIQNEDMLALARLDLRARMLQQEIQELREVSCERRHRRAEAWLRA